MIEQYARIDSLDRGIACLSVQKQATGCHGCSLNQGCGTALIAQLWPTRLPDCLQLPITSIPRFARAGDQVLLGINEAYLYQTVMLLYAAPLIGLLVGAVCGAWLGSYWAGANALELASIIAGLLGLSAGIGYARRQSAAHANVLERHMQVLKVMPAPVSVSPINSGADKFD